MLYGIREICDVVLRAKGTQHIGTKTFRKDMPVLYFDSLKTSSLDGAATTVYATGGRGNTRLIAWEGEKTVTFTMEDALISPVSLSVLSGAGVLEQSQDTSELANVQHATERTEIVSKNDKLVIGLTHEPHLDAEKEFYVYLIPLDSHGDFNGQPIRIDKFATLTGDDKLDNYNTTIQIDAATATATVEKQEVKMNEASIGGDGDVVMVDYYYKDSEYSITQIDIDAQNFAGNYYLEAATLWRDKNGEDRAAEFIIPNCKIQSNFTFSMAATGDPSTFTFTMDAFPDFTKYNKSKKVLCAMRIAEKDEGNSDEEFTGFNEVPKYSEPVVGSISYTNWRNAVKTSTTED